MKVAYCSQKEFDKLKPSSNTVVISLTGDSTEVIEDTGWKHFISTKFEVLNCRSEFRPTDDQAKRLADFIYPYIKDCETVIVQCQYGEIRSKAVAFGISVSDLGSSEVNEVVKGVMTVTEVGHMDTFQGRTYSWISRVIDSKLKESKLNDN